MVPMNVTSLVPVWSVWPSPCQAAKALMVPSSVACAGRARAAAASMAARPIAMNRRMCLVMERSLVLRPGPGSFEVDINRVPAERERQAFALRLQLENHAVAVLEPQFARALVAD